MRDTILVALLAMSCGGDFKSDGDACAGVDGSCLSLRVAGVGTIDSLNVRAIVKGNFIQMGESTGCPLPCSYRVRPPNGVAASSITGMTFTVTQGAKSYKKDLVFSWADGAHISQEIAPTF